MVHPMNSPYQSSVKVSAEQRAEEHNLSDSNRATFGQLFAVGFFSDLSDAEYAVTSLRSIGFPLNQVTLVANDFRRQDQFSGVNLSDRFEASHSEIPVEQARVYEERLKDGEYMVIVHGSEDELNCAASIFEHRRIWEWQIYNPSVVG